MYLSLDPVAESQMLVAEVAGTVRTPNEVRAKKVCRLLRVVMN